MIARSTYFRSMFFGYAAPTGQQAGVCLWFRVHPNHLLNVISELAFTHQLESDLAADILKRDRALCLGGTMSYTVANEECFSKATKTPKSLIGQTVADTFGLHGIPLVQGDPDTFNGWQRVRNYLRAAPDDEPWYGSPWLTIDASATHLVRGLSTALSDDLHADELASYAPSLHALRFAVMSQPAPDLIDEFTPAPPGTPKAIMQKLLAGNRDGRRFGQVR